MSTPNRRTFLAQSLAATAALAAPRVIAQPAGFRLAAFTADVTVPMGHGMMGGAWLSKGVGDPLLAKGVVLLGGDKPVVLVSVDWCEIRNAAFDRWREIYNARRPHSSLGARTPEQAYLDHLPSRVAA